MKLGTLIEDPCRIFSIRTQLWNAPWWPPSWISIWPPYCTYFCL